MAVSKVYSNVLLWFVRRILPIVSTIVIGVALSIAAYLYIKDVERQRVEAEFKQLAAGQATAIRKEIDLYITTLGSTRSLYATENVSRTKFHDFTSDILKRYRSTMALMWVPRVTASARSTFELDAEGDGLPNFYIIERRSDNQYYRAGERQEYFPTYYTDVNNGYDIVLGLDLSTDPAWAAAMMRARDEDHLVAVPYLSTTGDGANDIIVFNPIYQIGLPRETLDQRQRYFFGFTAAIYRVDDLVGNVLKTFKSDGVSIVVFDDSDSTRRTLLYGKALPAVVSANTSAAALDASKELSYVTTFEIAGRKWSIAATPSAQFYNGKFTSLPRATLAAGLAFTVLLTLYFISLIRRTAQVEKLVTERTAELSAAYRHLKESEAQLIHSEKMASLGQMVAGVAHEINTPLGYVSSTVEMLGERIDTVNTLVGDFDNLINMLTSPGTDDSSLESQFALVSGAISAVRSDGSMEETAQLLKDSMFGLNRIQEIVVGLKDFARLDRATTADFDVNKCLDQTLLIAQNLLKNRVVVTKRYGSLPNVTGSASQINQVLLNIIKNAAESIDGPGTITIKTWRDQETARISVEDTGCGIPADILPKIFDPFFTTKAVGSGTGLGLSISYKIIKQHGGDIVASSVAGKGTTFVISLPLAATAAVKMMA